MVIQGGRQLSTLRRHCDRLMVLVLGASASAADDSHLKEERRAAAVAAAGLRERLGVLAVETGTLQQEEDALSRLPPPSLVLFLSSSLLPSSPQSLFVFPATSDMADPGAVSEWVEAAVEDEADLEEERLTAAISAQKHLAVYFHGEEEEEDGKKEFHSLANELARREGDGGKKSRKSSPLELVRSSKAADLAGEFGVRCVEKRK